MRFAAGEAKLMKKGTNTVRFLAADTEMTGKAPNQHECFLIDTNIIYAAETDMMKKTPTQRFFFTDGGGRNDEKRAPTRFYAVWWSKQ